jgi:uncharacterized phage protein (TIGR01671 family)
MKREIKFRGKRTDTGEWIYGYYAVLGGKYYIYTGEKGLFQASPVHSIMYEEYKAIAVIPETVGQFTGLTDKNGKEIYEDDIFKITIYPRIYFNVYNEDGEKTGEDYTVHEGVLIRFQVVWNKKHCCFDAVIIHVNPTGIIFGGGYGRKEIIVGDKYDLESYFNEYSKEEIIGNIHDNQELLIKKNKLWN